VSHITDFGFGRESVMGARLLFTENGFEPKSVKVWQSTARATLGQVQLGLVHHFPVGTRAQSL